MSGHRGNKVLSRTIAAGLLAAGVLTAGYAQAQNVRIGALMSMTGGLAEYGRSILQGIQLAADEINAGGGVLDGRRIEVVVGDDQTSPQPGVAAAQQLVSVNRVVAIIGGLASGVTMPVATSVSRVNKIPQISPASTAPAITTLADDGFLFRTTPHDALQGVVLGDVVKEQGLNQVAVIFVNNDYGKGLAQAFAERFKPLGGTVTESIAFEEKQASYRGELQRAGRAKPEALVLIAYPGDGVPIVRQALEEGVFSKFVFSDGMKSTELIDAIGAKHLEGMLGTAPEALADSEAAVRFRKAFEAKHGELPPRPYIDTGYDAMYLLALAIERAKSTDGAAMRDALNTVANPPGEAILPGDWKKAKDLLAKGQDVDYVGTAGSQNFDKNGDVPGTFGIWQIKGGKIETLRVIEPKM
jgi:ABC-type branched-subunit amino acid transport system substrate-binding protein